MIRSLLSPLRRFLLCEHASASLIFLTRHHKGREGESQRPSTRQGTVLQRLDPRHEVKILPGEIKGAQVWKNHLGI